MKLKHIFSSTLLAAIVLFASLSAAQAKPVIFVSIVPQQHFMEQLVGDLMDVEVLVKSGANPHMYEPTPAQMAAMADAKAFFSVGINLEEAWLPRINGVNRSLRIIPAHRGIQKIPMVAHDHHDDEEHEEHHHDKAHEEHEHDHAMAEHDHDEDGHEEHGHEHHHHHDGLDPHIWLDPVRVSAMVTNMCNGLIKIDPEHKAVYEQNLTKVLDEIKATDKAVAAITGKIPADRRAFLVFHPSWGYFAARYGLTQMAIEAEGKEPSPKEMAEIIEHAKEKGIGAIFVQPQISQRSAQVIAKELGATVVVLDPLAKDWNNNLLKAADAFKATLK